MGYFITQNGTPDREKEREREILVYVVYLVIFSILAVCLADAN